MYKHEQVVTEIESGRPWIPDEVANTLGLELAEVQTEQGRAEFAKALGVKPELIEFIVANLNWLIDQAKLDLESLWDRTG